MNITQQLDAADDWKTPAGWLRDLHTMSLVDLRDLAAYALKHEIYDDLCVITQVLEKRTRAIHNQGGGGNNERHRPSRL